MPRRAPDSVEDCAGQYHDHDGHVLMIRCQSGQFSVQIGAGNSGDLDVEDLVPGSETLFFGLTDPVALTFVRDSNGKVTGVIRHGYKDHIRDAKFAPAPAGVAEADSDRFIGVWDGTLFVNEQIKIPTIIKIFKLTGSRKGSFDIPGEGMNDKPFKTLGLLSKSSLFLSCPTDNGRITLRVTLNDAATEMAGTWKNGQNSFPATFKRTTPKKEKTK